MVSSQESSCLECSDTYIFFYFKSQHGWIFKGYMHGGVILTNMPNDENGVPVFLVVKVNMALFDLTDRFFLSLCLLHT